MKFLLIIMTFISCGQVTDDNDTDGISKGEHRIFVTSLSYNGNVSGISGVDAICEQIASNAGLSKTYRAIISSSSENARDRLNLIGPVFKINSSGAKILVLEDPLGLFDGSSSLSSLINLDENGSSVSGDIWTGSTDTGTGKISAHCNNWLSSSNSDVGSRGTLSLSPSWLDDISDQTCDQLNSFYCISI